MENRPVTPLLDRVQTPADLKTLSDRAAMSAGMAFEALNNAGHLKRRMIVVLNDNEMSIALPDVFIDQASPEAMYRVAGMDAAQIEAKVLETFGVKVVGLRA